MQRSEVGRPFVSMATITPPSPTYKFPALFTPTSSQNPPALLNTLILLSVPPATGVPDLVLKHPRMFEYRLTEDGKSLHKGKARIQVDVVPVGTNGEMAVAVNYFREGASFLEAPVSPVGPMA